VQIISCPDLEPLLNHLALRLRAPLSDPFAAETIIVPTSDVASFLRHELGRRLGESGRTNGVVANVRFVFPRQLINATLSEPLGTLDSPWDSVRLTWRIASLINNFESEPLPRAFSVAPLTAARRTADLFDRYASHRPELLNSWVLGGAGDPAEVETRQWQRALFGRVADGIKTTPRAIDDLAVFEAALGVADLPDRISVFGVDSLSNSALQVLSHLSRHVDVCMYWTTPVATKSISAASCSTKRADYVQSDVRHPLTSRWAAHAIESTAVLGSKVELLASLERNDTLLHRIQDGVISDTPPPLVALQAEELSELLHHGDGSLQIHACYGLHRQAEALRDSLLHILNSDPSVRLRDILVVCGDVKSAAPVLNAVFNPEKTVGDNVPKLPINVLRGSAMGTDETTEAFFALLEVLTSRFSVSDVTDLAALKPISRKFSFDDDALDVLQTWAEQMRVKFGLTADSRVTLLNGSEIDDGTWALAVDRLMMGVAVTAETDVIGPGGVVPYDGVASSDIDTAGNLAEFLNRLEQASLKLRSGTPTEGFDLAEWRDLLLSLLDSFIDVPKDEAETLIRLQASIHEMYRESSAHPELTSQRFGVRDLQLLAAEYFSVGQRTFGSRFESITVAEFGGLNHLPYKVIAFVGADEKVFAGARVDGDDILAVEPRIGEPIYSLQGRNHLLNLILAARRALIITCTGADVRSNKVMQLAVPLRELMEHAAQVMHNMSTRPTSHRTFIRHPRHNFDVRPGDGVETSSTDEPVSPFAIGAVLADSPFTFDETARTSQAIIDQHRQGAVSTPERSGAASKQEKPAKALPTMATIHDVLEDPITYFYEDVLNVTIPKVEVDEHGSSDPDLEGDGILNLTLNALDRSAEGRALLQAIIKDASTDMNVDKIKESADRWSSVRELTGLLPPGELGVLVINDVAKELKKIVEVLLKQGLTTISGRDVDCEIDENGQQLRLRVENVVEGESRVDIVRLQYKRPKLPALLTLWADLAALTLETEGKTNLSGHYAARPETSSKKDPTYSQLSLKGGTPEARIANAELALATIFDIYRTAQHTVVPLFPTASPVLAKSTSLKGAEFRKVRDAWEKDTETNECIGWHVGDQDLEQYMQRRTEADSDSGLSTMAGAANLVWDVFYETTDVKGYGALAESGGAETASDEDGGDGDD